MMMMNNGLSQQVLHRPKAELVFRSSSFPAKNLVQIIFGAKLANSEPPSFPAKLLTFKMPPNYSSELFLLHAS
jgi:hypothetical protein